MPGLAALNGGGGAEVTSVSCPSAGGCAAGGDYSGRSRDFQGFVAVERDGRWGTAIEVPGLAALNKGGEAFADSVSCPSAGNCAVGGTYLDGNGQFRWYVASQRNGAWGKAIQVPGVRALPRGDARGTSRCRAPRRATAPSAGKFTAVVTGRCSLPSSVTAAGAGRSRCPGWRP